MFDTGDLTHVNLGKNNFDYEHQQGGYELQHRFSDCGPAQPELPLRPSRHQPFRLLPGCGRSGGRHGRAVPRRVRGRAARRSRRHHMPRRPATGPVSHAVLFGVDYQYLKDRVIFSSGEAPSLDLPRSRLQSADRQPTSPTSTNARPNENFGIYLQDQISYDEQLDPHPGRAPGLGERQSVDDELAGRHQRSGRPEVHLSRRPDLPHGFWAGPVRQLRHLVPADPGCRRRGRAVQADHRAAIRDRHQVSPELVRWPVHHCRLRPDQGERANARSGERPVRRHPGRRDPLARHRAGRYRQPRPKGSICRWPTPTTMPR